eukprot:9717639-Alexandrium_andersonii.AAC.1
MLGSVKRLRALGSSMRSVSWAGCSTCRCKNAMPSAECESLRFAFQLWKLSAREERKSSGVHR